MASLNSTNVHELSTPEYPVSLTAETAKPIRWHMHMVLLATAFVSWSALIVGIALSMRNMFGGPPPDDWGTVFVGVSMSAGMGGIGYFAMSRPRRLEATHSRIQRLLLVLVVLANAFPPGQIAVGIVSYVSGRY